MMLDPGDPWSVAITAAGADALASVRQSVGGQIAAVFERSFYAELDTGLVCVGDETLYAGPLNMVSAAPAGTSWLASGIRPGMGVCVAGSQIKVGQRIALPTQHAAEWRPPAPPAAPNALAIARGLSGIRAHARAALPDDGLGALIFKDGIAGDACVAAAQAPLHRLNARLRDAFRTAKLFRPDVNDLAALAGLGPGLTPAGDDVLGGMMIALHSLNRGDLAGDLWGAAAPIAAANTNAVSHAHLKAAAAGQGAEAVHALLAAILDGGAAHMHRHVYAIGAIGHSSGWDTMTGVVSVLDAWLHGAPRHQ